jgi:pimeloyl-ACP methyl ester carboxylesterase
MPTAVSPDGARVYYEVHGAGPALAFVHGTGGHHAAWWQQVVAFSDRFSVVTLDLPGFGNSPARFAPDGTLDVSNFDDDVIAVLQAADRGPAVLVGQSIGAAPALRAALRAPRMVTGVVLAHSLAGIKHPELESRVQRDRADAEQLPVLDRLLTPVFRAAHPAKAFLFQQMGTLNQAKMSDLRKLFAGGPTIAEVRGSGVPISFLTGEKDAVLTPATVRAAAALLPGTQLEIVRGAPHSMYFEAPDLFNAALDRLVQRILAGHRDLTRSDATYDARAGSVRAGRKVTSRG